MTKVINQINTGKFCILNVDTQIPLSNFRKIQIDGEQFDPVIVYDMPKSIGIEGNGNFAGKAVEFI